MRINFHLVECLTQYQIQNKSSINNSHDDAYGEVQSWVQIAL